MLGDFIIEYRCIVTNTLLHLVYIVSSEVRESVILITYTDKHSNVLKYIPSINSLNWTNGKRIYIRKNCKQTCAVQYGCMF